MRHEAKLVDGTIAQTSVHGVAFTMRCCGNPVTDASVHIQDAGFLSDEELTQKVSQYLYKHAELHARSTRAAVRVARLAATGHAACCDPDDRTIYTDATNPAVTRENDPSATDDNPTETPAGD